MSISEAVAASAQKVFLPKADIPNNWTWGMEREGLKIAESDRLVEMGKEQQAEFIKVIFDRYETMSKYTEPRAGEKKGQIQELDVLAEHVVKQIFHEHDRDEVMFDKAGKQYSEAQIINNMRPELKNMTLKNLRDDTRSLAFRVVEGTELEMMAACAKANTTRERPGRPGNRIARAIDITFRDKVLHNENVLQVLAFVTPNMPREGPAYEKWKRTMKGHYAVGFDPTGLGYESTYMQEWGFVRKNEKAQIDELYRVDDMRKAYLTATSGINADNPLWDSLVDITAGGGRANQETADYKKKQSFVNELDKVLTDEYGGGSFDALLPDQKSLALLEAVRRAAAKEAPEHINAILQKASRNDFAETNITNAEKGIKDLKPSEFKSPTLKKVEELSPLNTSYDQKWKAKFAADKAALDIPTEQLKVDPTVTGSFEKQRLDAEVKEAAATNPTDKRRWREEKDRYAADVDRVKKHIQNLTGVQDTAQAEYDQAIGELDVLLKDFASPTDYGKIVTGTPPTINQGELVRFLRTKTVEGQKETRDGQKKQTEAKEIGDDVLRLFKPDAQGNLVIDQILAAFSGGRVPFGGVDGIENPEEFAKILRLSQEGVLPADRLAKLLVVHMGLRMDPNDIPSPTKDAAKFQSDWDEIINAFGKKDGYGRAKIVLRIYKDRLLAMQYKKDPTADYLDYELPNQLPEMVPVRIQREALQDALASEGVIPGVNSIVLQVGDYVVVSEEGKMRIVRRSTTQNALTREQNIELTNLGDLGLSLVGDRVSITNVGTREAGDARDVLLNASNDRIKAGLETLVNAANLDADITCPDGNVRHIKWYGAGDIRVTLGPEVVFAPINIDSYLASYDFLNLEGGGRWFIQQMGERSVTLKDNVDFIKEKGYEQKSIEPLATPKELHWIDPDLTLYPDGSQIIVDLNDASGITLGRRSWDNVDKVWKVAEVLPAITSLSTKDFMDPAASDNIKLLRRKTAAAAFDFIAKMSPQQRRELEFTAKGVRATVDSMGLDGDVSVGIDDQGRLSMWDQAGTRDDLLNVMDLAVMENTTNDYHTLNPADPASILANQNLEIQEQMGIALWEALYRLNRK